MSVAVQYPKRLIEVDLPIKRISVHARREKSIRHGHISTLHIWWARRPLAACRAVICASLWPDPGCPLCPEAFRLTAKALMKTWAKEHLALLGEESFSRFVRYQKTPNLLEDNEVLRSALLDFIADFANWDNSNNLIYINTSRMLTQSAHETLGGEKGSRPLVIDPFAGGGAIPFETNRVGGEAFANDLNPIPVLLNKVAIEYLPKYGSSLAESLLKWGSWVKKQAERELIDFYPVYPDGSSPIAFLWARTARCEGPNCGAHIPLIGRPLISPKRKIGIKFKEMNKDDFHLEFDLITGKDAENLKPTCTAFIATCPRPACGFSTSKKSIQRQLSTQNGGTESSQMLAILTDGPNGRAYRKASENDAAVYASSTQMLNKLIQNDPNKNLLPNEPIPNKDAHRAVGSQLPLYGFKTWSDLFNSRQKLTLLVFQKFVNQAFEMLQEEEEDVEFAKAIFLLLAFAVDKQADYSSSLCRWVSNGEFIAGTLAGEKKIPMISDFAESNPIGRGSGSWDNHIEWIYRFLVRESPCFANTGTVNHGSASDQILPMDSACAMITDPPYYDSVPYSDLSDFYYVWIKRTLSGTFPIGKTPLTPKKLEMTVNHPNSEEEKFRYEHLMTEAFTRGREYTMPDGIGVVVFAHKSTSGWESLIEAIIRSGWVVTASWPIDTERSARPNAQGTASLSSSIHIVCRPRENPSRKITEDNVGDWREISNELPIRIHEWMPRLAEEGVVGADAIFACLGPALEVFSRYSRVEKASGDVVPLKDYLVQVWAAVAKEALSMVFAGGSAEGFEPDSRLTAMWLWTISCGGSDTVAEESEDNPVDRDDIDGGKKKPKSGFTLEYDPARKISQGLGANLDDLKSLVEVSGETARLLSVAERAAHLFGKEAVLPSTAKSRGHQKQQALPGFEEIVEEVAGFGLAGGGKAKVGLTVLDRVHQAMLLFGAGRSEAMKTFLMDEGVGQDARFWRLAQAFSALYPRDTQEKRWVDGVLARKKSLGF